MLPLLEHKMDRDGQQRQAQSEAIKETLAMHKLAVEGARQNPEGRVADIVDAAPFDDSATASLKKPTPSSRGRSYRRLSAERRANESIYDEWE